MEAEVDESVWGGRIPLLITAASDSAPQGDAEEIAPFYVCAVAGRLRNAAAAAPVTRSQ